MDRKSFAPFSLSSKSSSKRQSKPKSSGNLALEDKSEPPSSTTKEYVTEFDPTKKVTQSTSKQFVIPPKPNEWKPHKKMKSLDLPSVQADGPGQLDFEVNTVSTTTDSAVPYGLNLRQSKYNSDGPETGSEDRPRTEPIDALVLRKLKVDLDQLPEDAGFGDFDDMPVEEFGKALLGGYGWCEGKGIGKNAKEDVKVVECKRRAGREGFGFIGDVPKGIGNHSNGVASIVKGRNSGGGVEERYSVGKYVRVVDGRDVGLKGMIIEVKVGGDLVVLKLARREEVVTVRVCDITELGSVEEERCLRKLKELKIRESRYTSKKHSRNQEEGNRVDCEEALRRDSKDKSKKHSRSQEEGSRVDYKEEPRGDSKDNNKKHSRSHEDRSRVDFTEERREDSQLPWLTSHIRVRIISKELRGGRLYLKKGQIVDVVGPRTCDIVMDDSRELIQGVGQELLETALPRRGGPVLVLYGRHKGVYGSLMEKNMENETGVVRHAETHEPLHVRLEQIAEYTGDPSYIGY